MSHSVPTIVMKGKVRAMSPVTPSESRTKHAPRIPPEAWRYHEATIKQLYDSLPLDRLRQRIAQEHGFFATKAQYARQLKRWGLSKRRRLKAKLHDCGIATPSYGTPHDNKAVLSTIENPYGATEQDYELGPDNSHDSGFSSMGSSRSQDSGYHSRPECSIQDHCFIDPVGWDSVDLLYEVIASQPPSPAIFEEEYESIHGTHDQCLTGLATGSLPSVPDLEKLLVFSDAQSNLQAFKVYETAPSYSVSLDCSMVNHGESPPATLSKMTQAGSLTAAGGDYDGFSEVNGSKLSERSTSPDVDISIDLYRSALELFLYWIINHYTPELILRFEKRSLLHSSESSLRAHATTNGSNDSSATPGGSTPDSSQGSNKRNGKRAFISPDGPGGQQVQNDEQATELPVTVKRRRIKLACHFHKLNAGKFSTGRYKTCPNGFDGLNRLKEHQTYVHRPAHYCKRCKRIFNTQDLKDAHDDQDVRCQRREDPTFADYLTSDVQRAALARKKPAGMKDEDFWYEMWDKYFTGVSRPASAFQDLDPTLAAFQSFAEREAVSTVQAYYAFNPEHGLTMEELTRFWHFAIYYIVASFASQQGYQSSLSSVGTEASQPPQQRDYISELLQSYTADLSFTLPDFSQAEFDETL